MQVGTRDDGEETVSRVQYGLRMVCYGLRRHLVSSGLKNTVNSHCLKHPFFFFLRKGEVWSPVCTCLWEYPESIT